MSCGFGFGSAGDVKAIIRETLPDFVLAGKTAELSRWAEHAANLGILWCYEHERRGGNRCSSCCIRGGFCAIAADSVLLIVLPDGITPAFDEHAYEATLVLIPSKKTLKMADLDGMRSLVSRLMSAFRDSGVDCFESGRSPEGGLEWKAFAGPT
jgi:hypothetical protein